MINITGDSNDWVIVPKVGDKVRVLNSKYKGIILTVVVGSPIGKCFISANKRLFHLGKGYLSNQYEYIQGQHTKLGRLVYE